MCNFNAFNLDQESLSASGAMSRDISRFLSSEACYAVENWATLISKGNAGINHTMASIICYPQAGP